MTTVPDLPDFCWPVDTSTVELWDSLSDPDEDEGEDNPPLYSDAVKARAVALAGQAMRLLTGYRVGGCPIKVRPCRARCQERTWRTYPVAGASGSTPWQPVSLGGRWLNIGCGCASACSCSVISEVALFGQVGAVTQVKIDGLVLSPSAYRVDPGGLLVRTDGLSWPLCQDMAAPDTAAGTWSVTYVPGQPVDGLGAWAAGVLAGEFASAMRGGECRLPAGVTQIIRQGVSMTFAVGAFPEGRTGIREVDVYLEAVNPYALKAPSTVWSPDLARPRAVR